MDTSHDYHQIEYWLNNPTCSKLSIDGETYHVEQIKHFVIDSYVMQSVMVHLSGAKLLMITRYGEINTRCMYHIDAKYIDRYQAYFMEGALFDLNEDDEQDIDSVNISDAKYQNDLIEENKSIDNMIFDKCYEAYGTIEDVDSSIVEYYCHNETLANNHILFLETGDLYGDGGGNIVKYRGREIYIDYIVDDDLVTVQNV
jgi:hypothetical protein